MAAVAIETGPGRAFAAGARTAIPVGITFFFAFLGVGAVFRVAGLEVAQASLSTLVLMSGPAQMALVDGIRGGQPLAALILAVCVINGRYLVMSAAAAPSFGRVPLGRLLLPWTFLSTTTFATLYTGLRDPGVRSQPLAYFWGLIAVSVPGAVLGTVAGHEAAGLMSGSIQATVEMILPIYFATLLAREWPRRQPLVAAGLGLAWTPICQHLLPQAGLLLASVAVGLAVGLVPGKEDRE
jgi:predicted branched-subunit amino acid permease